MRKIIFTHLTQDRSIDGRLSGGGSVVYHAYRPHYGNISAKLVVDWLNGEDRPLKNMVPRQDDETDPLNRFPNRQISRRVGVGAVYSFKARFSDQT